MLQLGQSHCSTLLWHSCDTVPIYVNVSAVLLLSVHRSLPVYSAVCTQSPVRRQNSQSGGHRAAASSENEERLDPLGSAADWNMWCRYDSYDRALALDS